jgi:leader peptidase (prepilin peptidase)/N-methyltransferase
MLFCDGTVARCDFFRIKKFFSRNKPLGKKLRNKLVAHLPQNNFFGERAYSRHKTDTLLSLRWSQTEPSIDLGQARMFVDTEAPHLLGFSAALCLLCGALALIDIRRGIIPDRLNLSIAGLGLMKAVSAGGAAAGIEAICEGAAVGLIFWLLRRLYFIWRKIQGLGLGDVKFLAAATPWIGIAGIPMLLLIATLTALAAAGGLQLAGRDMTRQTSLPFGPFLAVGLLLTFVSQQVLGAV